MNFLLYTDVPDFAEPSYIKSFKLIDYEEEEFEEKESECSCGEPMAAACTGSS